MVPAEAEAGDGVKRAHRACVNGAAATKRPARTTATPATTSAYSAAERAAEQRGGLKGPESSTGRAATFRSKDVCLGISRCVAGDGDVEVIFKGQRNCVGQGKVQFALADQQVNAQIGRASCRERV